MFNQEIFNLEKFLQKIMKYFRYDTFPKKYVECLELNVNQILIFLFFFFTFFLFFNYK